MNLKNLNNYFDPKTNESYPFKGHFFKNSRGQINKNKKYLFSQFNSSINLLFLKTFKF